MEQPRSDVSGQTALEYMILCAIVAVVVLFSFREGNLLSQVRTSSEGYFNSVTRVIMGDKPAPINGGWCGDWAPDPCPEGVSTQYRTCNCPAPAFGGAQCPGSADRPCP